MPERRQRIPEEKWEKHKGDIVSHFLETDLKHVIEQMRQRHGFPRINIPERSEPGVFTSIIIPIFTNLSTDAFEGDKHKGNLAMSSFMETTLLRTNSKKEIARNVTFTDRCYYTENASTPHGVLICSPPETMVFPQNRDLRIDNLPWLLFNQEVQSQTILYQTLSGHTTFMSGGSSDAFGRHTLLPAQDLILMSIYPSTSGFNNWTFDCNNMFDSLPGIGSACDFLQPQINESVEKYTNLASTPIDHELQSASLSALMQKDRYLVEESSVQCSTPSSRTPEGSLIPYPNVYQLFSLFIFMATNSFLSTEGVGKIYALTILNGMSLSTHHLTVYGIGGAFGPRYHSLLDNEIMQIVKVFCNLGVTPTVLREDIAPLNGVCGSLWAFQNIGILRLLLNYNADPDCLVSDDTCKATGDFGTVLQAAAARRHIQIAKALIEAGADIDLVSRVCVDNRCYFMNRGSGSLETPIQLAAEVTDTEMALLLLQSGASVNFRSMSTVLDTASRLTMFFRALRMTAGGQATQNENIRLVHQLLVSGAAVDSRYIHYDDTPHQIAARSSSMRAAFWSTIVHASPANDNGRTAIQTAAESGNIAIVQMFLDMDADVNASPGWKIVRKNNIYLLKFLLQAGDDVNAFSLRYLNMTALPYAVKQSWLEGVQRLLNYYSDIPTLPLCETEAGRWDTCTSNGYLIRHLISRNAGNHYGEAIRNSLKWVDGIEYPPDIDLLRLLLDAARAPISGGTAIDAAAEHGHLDMLQLLLNAYGDREGLAVCSQTASFAEREGHIAMAVWLRAYVTS
ncbi:ankyrin repeat-containing protein, putative [Talaromyces stipitatus ATCC 10500]|uniref:Ankyrin repeat-containing protein, putative n=1 Tax=Talaromyces stipitatus (strain ATCC 10500 / CBS 375.48 / QM 6759 / NRRL 1006) TaxID=441959 RepID=B8MM95_TALSN|nr:ankyrin repeat-containing protein, putative [Talaromyces stipitatus ATCC 10500]EED13649.1 ankyrin repeat-containing protein, putative [Talaromyces stipitatus ATCC 10500]